VSSKTLFGSYLELMKSMLHCLFRPFLWHATCVSSTESYAEETLSTLDYVKRARNIKNKCVVRKGCNKKMHGM
jgi:hypothetical protein